MDPVDDYRRHPLRKVYMRAAFSLTQLQEKAVSTSFNPAHCIYFSSINFLWSTWDHECYRPIRFHTAPAVLNISSQNSGLKPWTLDCSRFSNGLVFFQGSLYIFGGQNLSGKVLRGFFLMCKTYGYGWTCIGHSVVVLVLCNQIRTVWTFHSLACCICKLFIAPSLVWKYSGRWE